MRQSDLSDRLRQTLVAEPMVKVPERRQVTWGVYLSRLADWLEEEQTGQRRLAL